MLPARANQPLHHAELLIVLNANIDSLEVGKVSRAPLLGSVGPPGLFLRAVGFSGPLRVARGLPTVTAETHHVGTWRTRHEAPVAEAISSWQNETSPPFSMEEKVVEKNAEAHEAHIRSSDCKPLAYCGRPAMAHQRDEGRFLRHQDKEDPRTSSRAPQHVGG